MISNYLGFYYLLFHIVVFYKCFGLASSSEDLNRPKHTHTHIHTHTCIYIYIYVYIYFPRMYHHHHHYVAPPSQLSLTFSCHPSLLSITSAGSSRLHSVSTQSCCMSVLAGHPAFAYLCEEVHWSMSLMSLSLLL